MRTFELLLKEKASLRCHEGQRNNKCRSEEKRLLTLFKTDTSIREDYL